MKYKLILSALLLTSVLIGGAITVTANNTEPVEVEINSGAEIDTPDGHNFYIEKGEQLEYKPETDSYYKKQVK